MTSFVRLGWAIELVVNIEGYSGGNVQVGTDSRLVLVTESLVDILVHERGLSDTELDT